MYVVYRGVDRDMLIIAPRGIEITINTTFKHVVELIIAPRGIEINKSKI